MESSVTAGQLVTSRSSSPANTEAHTPVMPEHWRRARRRSRGSRVPAAAMPRSDNCPWSASTIRCSRPSAPSASRPPSVSRLVSCNCRLVRRRRAARAATPASVAAYAWSMRSSWRAVKPAMAVRVASVMAPACSSGPRHDRARRTRQDRHGSRERHPASDRAACCWCPSRACRLVSAVSAVAAVRPASPMRKQSVILRSRRQGAPAARLPIAASVTLRQEVRLRAVRWGSRAHAATPASDRRYSAFKFRLSS
mmetsp:Transcript_19470/g.58851  ORF Transcript_19470/g.58851 Transcript_19470/m.58851 type:complete len:253 (+) Transcript_19470:3728-4486(+)